MNNNKRFIDYPNNQNAVILLATIVVSITLIALNQRNIYRLKVITAVSLTIFIGVLFRMAIHDDSEQ
jgi:hypothetical protein